MDEDQNLNITDIVNNEMQPTVQPPIVQMQQSLQQKAIDKQTGATSLYDSLKVPYFGGSGIKQENTKPSLEFEVPIEEGYNLVAGEYIAKYPTYEVGRDNAEYAAQNQSAFDKWTNGLTKAGANLLTTIAGNTVGFVVGATEGITQGSWNAVFDNGFSNMLADYNDKLNYQLPNYVSKDEQDDNFAESLFTHNFWAKDVAGGFSFTLGTIASEAIWAYATGGIANSAKWGLQGAKLANKARWGKVALGAEETAVGLANYKKFVASGLDKLYRTGAIEARTATAFANTAKVLNTTRFLATSSGNEAGIEALQYKREQTENFYRDFEKLNGRDPSEEEIIEFNDNLEASANAVFATNMAILAPSNIAMFGSLFNISNPTKGISKAMNKSLFGIGVEKVANEAGEIAYKGLQATGRQKVAQYAYASLKPLLTEGLWEEGMQGVTTKTAENWITSTYNPKYNNKTLDLSDATYKAFAEQYGSKEGWKEIGIGAIIGSGSSVLIGKGNFQEIREFRKEQEYQDKYVAEGLNQFGDNSALATDSIVKKFMMNARITNAVERQKESIDKGDDVGAMLAQQDVLLAEMQFRKAMGENTKDLISKYETAIQALPQEAFDQEGIEDPSSYKTTVIESYKNLVNSYEKASDFADAVLGDSKILGQDIETQSLKDALTYSIVSGEKANTAMNGLLSDMGQVIGDDSVKAMQIQTTLQKMGRNKQQQVRRLNTNITQNEQEVKNLSKELQRLQVSKDEDKGTRLQKVQEKLTDALERQTILKSEREVLAQEVSQESSRRRLIQRTDVVSTDLTTEFISGSNLENIDQKLQRIEDSIKSYQGINHEIYYELLDLKRQYLSAKESFFSFQKSVDSIINGEFSPKFSKMNGLLGQVFQNKPVDNFTNKFLAETFDNYKKSVERLAGNSLLENYISDEDYNVFVETGAVSNEILTKLAEQVKNKAELTDRESQIYSAKTNEVNLLTAPNPNKPDLTIPSQTERELRVLEAERTALVESIKKITEPVILYHTSDTVLTLDDISVEPRVTRQGKKGQYGGFYAYDNLTDIESFAKGNNVTNIHKITLKPGVEIRNYTGSIERLDKNTLDSLRKQGYQVIRGKSLFGKSEIIIIDKSAIDSIGRNESSELQEIYNKLETTYNTLLQNGKNDKEATSLALEALTKEERDVLRNEKQPTRKQNKNTISKEIEVLDRRILELRAQSGALTEAELLRQQIEQAFEKDYPLLTQDVDEMIKDKPTKEEIEKYRDLYQEQETLTETERADFEELQPRMQKWFMAQSLPVRSATIADLVELLSQLETIMDRNETLDEIDSDALVLETVEQKDSHATERQDILQNISGNAVVKIVKDDIYFIHTDVKSLVDKLLPTVNIASVQTVNNKGKLNKEQDLTPKILNENNKTPGTIFKIGNTKITIGQRGSVVMPLADYNQVKDILNMYYFDSNSGKWSYADLYEFLEDGTTRKIQSEFETNTISDYLYDASIGDGLNLFVDMQTPWNQDLIYESLQEIENDGLISAQTKKKIQDKLEITSRKGRDNNSTLKALYEKDPKLPNSANNAGEDNFMYVRKKYADRFVELLESEQSLLQLPERIDLNAEINVKDMFLGTPNFQLDNNLVPKELPITERGVETVITQGYVTAEEMVLANKNLDTENISRLYVTNITRLNPESKIPVVVLQKGKYQFAFPISMVKTIEDRSQSLEDILMTLETPVEVAKAVNNLMISLGSNTRITAVTSEVIEEVRTELQNYTLFRTADEIAETSYNKNRLISDATIKIDLENEVISSPKVTVDFSTLTIGNLEDTETDAGNLRQSIVEDLREIEKIVNSSIEIPDQNRLIEAFDNNAVENKGTDIMNRKDINFIKEVFFTPEGRLKSVRGRAVEVIGADKLSRLRDKLQQLQFYESQIKTIKDKNTERNLNCN